MVWAGSPACCVWGPVPSAQASAGAGAGCADVAAALDCAGGEAADDGVWASCELDEACDVDVA